MKQKSLNHCEIIMKNVRVYWFVATAVLILSGTACSEKSSEVDSLHGKKRIVLNHVKQSPIVEETVIPGNHQGYLPFLKETENIIGISSTKDSPVDEAWVNSYIVRRDQDGIGGSTTAEPIVVMANGKDLTTITPPTRSGDRAGHELFGRDVRIQISRNPLTRSDEEEEAGVDLYSPVEIEITAPRVDQAQDLLPLCYYDGFLLKWNQDENNPNGVVIILQWTGEKVVGEEVAETAVRRTVIVEDTGSVVLDKHMFDGIPDTAVCHLTILRGDIEILDYENETYKVLTETHEFLSFILIREITERHEQ